MSSDISISSSTLTPSSRSTPVSSPEAQTNSAAVDQASGAEAQQRRVEQAQEAQQTLEARQESMERLVEEINQFASHMSRNLNFSVDDPTGHTVITVTEKESGDLVRRIPSEEFLALSQSIQDMNNLLFKEKA